LEHNRPTAIDFIDGDVNKLFPYLVHFARNFENEAAVKLLFVLLSRCGVHKSVVSIHMHLVIETLLNYRGFWAYQVGLFMARIVEEYGDEQPNLARVMERVSTDYNFIIKAVAYEMKMKAPILSLLGAFLRRGLQSSHRGSKMAMLCLRVMLLKSVDIRSFIDQGVRLPVWIPSPWLDSDPYLESY
jgi:hypothetical protein